MKKIPVFWVEILFSKRILFGVSDIIREAYLTCGTNN